MDLKKYQILWTKSFKTELNNIYDYISIHLQNTIAAENIHSKIISSLCSLRYFPNGFSKINISPSESRELRKLTINNYTIVYKVNNKSRQVFILHIFYKGQNYIEKL